MRDRITQRAFKDKRLHSGKQDAGSRAVRCFLNVESGSLRTCVVKIQNHSRTNFLLHIDVPDLDVSQSVVRIYRVAVRDQVKWWRRKPILQSQRQTTGFHVRLRGGERRLESKLLDDAGVRGGVVIDAVSGAHYCF